MYNVRMTIAFVGTALFPYWLNYQILSIPLTLGVVAAALSDIDDRFSVRLRNLLFTYVGFFTTAALVEVLFPHPILFAFALILMCFSLILLGSLGKRYATISYGCLVISVYTMLGVDLFPNWYEQPALLVAGAAWYGILSTISFLLFPVRVVQDQLDQCYRQLGNFLFVKSNLFDVDMTSESYQQSMIDLSLASGKVISIFNETRVALLTRLKGDRGQKDTRRSLQYYFIAQDIHERTDSAHIDYLQLAKVFQHRDILFRFQRILSLQAKACQDLAYAISNRQPYHHNSRFKYAFKNLNNSLEQLTKEQHYDMVWIKSLYSLQKNLKEIDAQLLNLESERAFMKNKTLQKDDALKDDDLTGWKDIKQRILSNFSPESGLFRHATRLSILLLISHVVVQLMDLEYGYWILLTVLFVCQPNFNATRRRLKLRIIGTLAGVLLGTFFLHFIPSNEGLLIISIISGVLFLQLRSQQYAQATMFITLLALINFHFADPQLNAALPRAIYTIIGCCLAWFGVMFIWPDWKFRRLPNVLQRTLTNQCAYLAEIVKQYHNGRNNGLDYRLVRRQAHVMDAELASLISTLATEPEFDALRKQQAFKFLCLNHTMLSYIAALGAHRQQLDEQEILDVLDQAFSDIQGALLFDERPELKAQAAIETLRQHIQKDHLLISEPATLVLQQIVLMLNILPELSQLKQNLNDTDDPHATALASL
ncbi:TIGR01666 family membrane protein [Acinetobacter qingfengensis]|uniref:TIGR01666 family membrane protein n=2 Tax=Acinetobacter qingfengensis TaxID=1262585 RepID=A0A1E7RDC5_9GAMM|nr:TIGR01666 family membrane protein [Acinetobacter qingfengensis]OEY97341.1 TIGR01666 family membrane protein [Acinetobacter qingfengensis]